MEETITEAKFNYKTYRFLLSVWMLNEVSIVFQPVEISTNGFYLHAIFYILSVIFFSMPIVYSEICIVQFTNFDVVEMWNFCPLLKGAGYATLYLALLKVIFLNVLSSWYLIFAFYSVSSSPPWYSCDDFNDELCMVKRVNVSIFQHCLQALTVLGRSCGMKTASSYFFEREISNNTTQLKECLYLWKPIVATSVTNLLVYSIFCFRRPKLVAIVSRGFLIFFSIVLFVLLVVSLLNNGTWFASNMSPYMDFEQNWAYYFNTILTRGMVSCGTGLGVIGYLTRGVSFRSPATMTAILVTSYGMIATTILSMILFNAIKSVSYYHGEAEKILEVGHSIFFDPYASVIEILSYFGAPLWTFLWLFSQYLCLVINIWITYMFLYDQIAPKFGFSEKQPSLCCMMFVIIIMFISHPFFCCDLSESLSFAIEILQLINLLMFSIGLYWIYGYRNHITDITFMIGIKSNIIWQIAWVLYPLILIFNIYVSFSILDWDDYSEITDTWSIRFDKIIFWLLLSIYLIILAIGIALQLRYYIINKNIKKIFLPSPSWGPKQKILLRSRQMFEPDIMTREFLYRQVKIHGYRKKKNSYNKQNNEVKFEESISDKTKWNALTSN